MSDNCRKQSHGLMSKFLNLSITNSSHSWHLSELHQSSANRRNYTHHIQKASVIQSNYKIDELHQGVFHIMIFSGQESSDSIRCWIPTDSGQEDQELFNLFTDTIKWLALVVMAARSQDLNRLKDRERWPSELLLGYATLAVNESRALGLLVAQGLNRQARVHFRSLYDFELRMRRVLNKDENIAVDLRDAYAFETRALGKRHGIDSETTETKFSRALGVPDASLIVGQKRVRF